MEMIAHNPLEYKAGLLRREMKKSLKTPSKMRYISLSQENQGAGDYVQNTCGGGR